jgi:hypothetical protein
MNRSIAAAAAFALGLGLANGAYAQKFAEGVVTFYNTLGSTAPSCAVITLEGPQFTPGQTFALFPIGSPVFEDQRSAALASLSGGMPVTLQFGNAVPNCEGWPSILKMNVHRR